MTTNQPTPDFAAWQHDTLAKFAAQAHLRLQQEQAANEQLRLDLRYAMKLARQQNIGHNSTIAQKPTI